MTFPLVFWGTSAHVCGSGACIRPAASGSRREGHFEGCGLCGPGYGRIWGSRVRLRSSPALRSPKDDAGCEHPNGQEQQRQSVETDQLGNCGNVPRDRDPPRPHPGSGSDAGQ